MKNQKQKKEVFKLKRNGVFFNGFEHRVHRTKKQKKIGLNKPLNSSLKNIKLKKIKDKEVKDEIKNSST